MNAIQIYICMYIVHGCHLGVQAFAAVAVLLAGGGRGRGGGGGGQRMSCSAKTFWGDVAINFII